MFDTVAVNVGLCVVSAGLAMEGVSVIVGVVRDCAVIFNVQVKLPDSGSALPR